MKDLWCPRGLWMGFEWLFIVSCYLLSFFVAWRIEWQVALLTFTCLISRRCYYLIIGLMEEWRLWHFHGALMCGCFRSISTMLFEDFYCFAEDSWWREMTRLKLSRMINLRLQYYLPRGSPRWQGLSLSLLLSCFLTCPRPNLAGVGHNLAPMDAKYRGHLLQQLRPKLNPDHNTFSATHTSTTTVLQAEQTVSELRESHAIILAVWHVHWKRESCIAE